MDEYYPPETVVTEKYTLHLYHPIISEEERAKRMKIIKEAAIRLLRSTMQAEAEREQQEAEAAGTSG